MTSDAPVAAKWPALLVLCALVLAPGCSKKPKQEPSPLEKLPLKEAMVVVDGHEISGAWLRNWCVTQYLTVVRATGGAPMKIDEYTLIEGGMDLLGKMYVVALEAQRRGVTVTEEEVQTLMSKEAARFESTDDWRQKLEKSGLTVEQRRDQVRIEALFTKFQDTVLAPEVRARFGTDEMAKDYYDRHPDIFKEPRQIHIFHITRSVSPESTEQLKAKEREAIEKARARIAGGESFEAVAREVSTEASALKGGDVGWVTEDAPIHPDLKAAVLKLGKGDLSPVLTSPNGFHIFKAVDVKEPGVRKFEDAKEEIKKRLTNEALKLEMEKTAQQLRQQLVAQKKYMVRDLKQLLGPKPPPPPAPAAPQAPAAPAAKG